MHAIVVGLYITYSVVNCLIFFFVIARVSTNAEN